MKRKWIVAIVVLVAIGAAVALVYHRRQVAASASNASTMETAVVTRGQFTKTVSATGNLAPAEDVGLSFGSSGTVAHVYVAVGDAVTQGQPLAALDTSDLELSLSSAEADLASAQAGLVSAQASRKDLLAGPSASDVEQAKIAVDQAKDRLWGTQAQRDSTCGRVKNKQADQSACDSAESSVLQGESAVRLAEIQYQDVLDGPSATDVRSADDKVTQAQAQVASAEVRLSQAKLAVDEATLTSPITGTITALDMRVGQSAGSSQSSTGSGTITVSDLQSLDIDISVAESDIDELAVDQPAQVTLDAFPGQTLDGRVVEVSPVASVESGVVLFPVTVRVQPGDLGARAGMTANVDITTVNEEDALMVPIRAVITADDGTYAMRLATAASLQGQAAGASASPGAAGAQATGNRRLINRQTAVAAGTQTAGGASSGQTSSSSSTGGEGPGGARGDVVVMGGGPPGGREGEFAFGNRGGASSQSAGQAGGTTLGSVSGVTASLADAQRVKVTLGPSNDSVAVIRDGLSEGDVVLVAGSSSSSQGANMRVLPMGGFFGVRQ